VSTVEFDETSSELGEPGAAKMETANVAAAPQQPAAPTKQIYTMLAREGVNAAELINTALRKRTVGKAVARRVEVIAPHGPSTSGGRKARQSITLVQVSGTGPAIMIGFLDVAQKTAQLRDHAAVAQQYRARFGGELDITEQEHAELVKALSGMLGTLSFKISHGQDAEEQEHASEAPGGRRAPTLPKLLILAAGTLVVIAVIALLLR
jgi:hypothetical protein